MEEGEEVTNVRKTRSGRAVRTPPSAKPKSTAKPASRKTRKKVVLMEVEVTDDEDAAALTEEEHKEKETKAAEEEAKNEDKLLESSEESRDVAEDNKNEDSLLNNSDDSETKKSETVENGSKEVEDNLVLNDIEMLEEILQTNEKIAAEAEQDKKVELIEVIEVEDIEESTITVEKDKGADNETGKVIIEEAKPKGKKGTAQTKKSTVEITEIIEIQENVEIAGGKADKKNEVHGIVEEPKEDEKQKSVTKERTEETKIKEEMGDKPQQKIDRVIEKEEKSENKKELEMQPKVALDEKKEQAVEKKEKTKQNGDPDAENISDDELPGVPVAKVPETEEVSDEELPGPKRAELPADTEVVSEDELPTVGTKRKLSESDRDPNEKAAEDKPNKSAKIVKEEGEKSNKGVEVQEDKSSVKEVKEESDEKTKESPEQKGDPDAENISEDELPGVPVAKVPETDEVSDEELPGPKRAELPADTEVVSEDELPTVKKEDELPVKKEGTKRKLSEGDYDPGSPTSENEAPTKKPSLEVAEKEKEKDEKPPKPKKLPELDKYWKAVNDDPTDFTGWTYLLQYVDQENDMEAAREAYDAFLSHYPYCYGYWRKYADYEKRKGNKKKCEEVFERGLKAIPLSVDLWIHYLTYVKATKPDDEEYIRSQFERALTACGLEFRSDRLWDSYIKWETEAKRFQKVTAIYDKLLGTPTQGYTSHFDNFQEHISTNPPNKVVEVDEFLALRKEVRHMLKHDVTSENPADNADVPPGDEDSKLISSDEETKCIRERIVSIRRKIHKNTVNAVTTRWNYEEGIKRPYFHVKPLERCQLKNWQDYLDYEIEQGDRIRIIVLFERCLIACALYEEFWLKFVHYLEGLKDAELQPKIKDVYERACTIHHLKKPHLHLQWAMFEESVGNGNRAAEILVNLEKSVPNVLQVAYRRINLERRRADHEKCAQLYEHYINSSKNKMVASNIAIKYSRFCLRILKDHERAQEVLRLAITKDQNNPRLYLQLVDLTLQKESVTEEEVCLLMDEFLGKESADADQKVLFAQRKLEYLEDFGSSIQTVQSAYEQYQKFIKLSKDSSKKKETLKSETSSSKKEKSTAQSSSQSGTYGNYNYGNSSNQTSYPYSGSQQGQYNYSQYGQGDQYQYQNWQYPQGGYGGYNQWGGYGGGYGY